MNNQLTNTLADGTAPFVITSTTLVSKLNVERWGGFLVSSAITLTNTTDSTTKDTGALILEGGLGVEKSIVAGGGLTAGSVTSGGSTGAYFVGAGDNFTLRTYTNTPNPNWTIGYGNGAGAVDTTKEYMSANAGVFNFYHAGLNIPNGGLTATQGTFNIADGTAPLVITSTTKVAKLNVEQVDGYDLDQALLQASSPTFSHLSLHDYLVFSADHQADSYIDFYAYKKIGAYDAYTLSIWTTNAANNGFVERMRIGGHAAQGSSSITMYESLTVPSITTTTGISQNTGFLLKDSSDPTNRFLAVEYSSGGVAGSWVFGVHTAGIDPALNLYAINAGYSLFNVTTVGAGTFRGGLTVGGDITLGTANKFKMSPAHDWYVWYDVTPNVLKIGLNTKEMTLDPSGNAVIIGSLGVGSFSSDVTTNSANAGWIGNSIYYWYRAYVNTYYGKNTGIQSFDHLDDLAILKTIEHGSGYKLPDFLLDDTGQFVNIGYLAGFQIGVSKQLFAKIELLEATIESLRAENAEIKQKMRIV